MRKTNKKGFTIVELVIVIAVIAILAAVLIPTYSSLVKKANQSADIQAVREMNTALAVNEVTEGKDIRDVYAALTAAGMSAKDYIPLTDGNLFFWLQDDNRVVYTDKDYNIIFPENYKNDNLKTKFAGKHFSLGGLYTEKKVTVSEDGTATITTAEELYYLSNNSANVKEIIINTDKLDLAGANISFTVEAGKTLSIKGCTEGTVLNGLVMLDSKWTDPKVNKNYASGFVAKVTKGTDANPTKLTLENITIDGATIGNLETGAVGALVGRIEDYTEVTIKKCEVLNTTVNGKNKVGALVGSVAGCELKVESCKVDHVTVNCSEGESGIVIGNVYNNLNKGVTIDTGFTWVTNSTLNLVATGRGTIDISTLTWYGQKSGEDHQNKTEEKVTIGGLTKLVEQWNNGAHETKYNCKAYRVFVANAYMTMQDAKVGEETYKLSDTSNNGMYAEYNKADIRVNALHWILKSGN